MEVFHILFWKLLVSKILPSTKLNTNSKCKGGKKKAWDINNTGISKKPQLFLAHDRISDKFKGRRPDVLLSALSFLKWFFKKRFNPKLLDRFVSSSNHLWKRWRSNHIFFSYFTFWLVCYNKLFVKIWKNL